jgi:cytidylate kinase
MIITIDGPVASGKSTVARQLAQELGFYYLYTGFLYRGVAYVLVKFYQYEDAKLATAQPDDLKDLLEQHEFEYRYEQGKPYIFFDGVDVTPFLKTKAVDNWSSLVSAQPIVRHAIFEYQVSLGCGRNVVAEGRDMATVVFPQAEYKFFLTASEEVRAWRWQRMQEQMGNEYTREESVVAVHERDKRDKERVYSPLKPSADTHIIDGSNMTVAEIIAIIKSFIKI